MKDIVVSRVDQTLVGHRSYIDKVRESTISNQFKNVSETSGETRRDVQLNYRFTPGRRSNIRKEESLQKEEISYASEVFEEVLFRAEGTIIRQDEEENNHPRAPKSQIYPDFYVDKSALLKLADKDSSIADVSAALAHLSVTEELLNKIINRFASAEFSSFALVIGVWTQYILASGGGTKEERRLALKAFSSLEKYSYAFRRGIIFAAKAMKTQTLQLTVDSDGDDESLGLRYDQTPASNASGQAITGAVASSSSQMVRDSVYNATDDWNLLCTARKLETTRRHEIKLELASAFQNLAVEVTQALRIMKTEVGAQERRGRGRPTRSEQDRRDSIAARFKDIGGAHFTNDFLDTDASSQNEPVRYSPQQDEVAILSKLDATELVAPPVARPDTPTHTAELLPQTRHAIFERLKNFIRFEDYDCVVELHTAGASLALNSPVHLPAVVVPLNPTVARMVKQAPMCADHMVREKNFSLNSLAGEEMSVTSFAILPSIAGLAEDITFKQDGTGVFQFTGVKDPLVAKACLENVIRAAERLAAAEIRIETMNPKAATPFGRQLLLSINIGSEVADSVKEIALQHLRDDLITFNKVRTLILVSDAPIDVARLGISTGKMEVIPACKGTHIVIASELTAIAPSQNNLASTKPGRLSKATNVKHTLVGIVSTPSPVAIRSRSRKA